MKPKFNQNVVKIRPKPSQGRSKSGPEKVSKNDTEISANRGQTWTPKIVKNHEKRVSKNEVDHRRAPGAPQGRYWSHFGGHFDDFLMYFSVFPCVYYVFHVKIYVFPCVYDDLTLRFFVFFERANLLVFFCVLSILRKRPAKIERENERASKRQRENERDRERMREREKERAGNLFGDGDRKTERERESERGREWERPRKTER